MARRERAGTRQWLGLALWVLPTLLLAACITVLYLALPHLSADLGPSSNQTLGSSTATASFSSGFPITMGLSVIASVDAGSSGSERPSSGWRRCLRPTPRAQRWSSPPAPSGPRGGHHAAVHRGADHNMFEDPSQWTRAIGVWAASFSTDLPWAP